ncbi:MAG: hypothetical protein JSW61_10500 [Candidatus Thorarchaeota archaeon]|nr:MAG: hypothetical protein JSW61_10500 [Candidatus Thorarchaeota archaeon]
METGIFHGYMTTILLAFILQQTGFWVLMIPAGAIGAVFTRRILHAFVTGFLGVATAWSMIFLYLNYIGQAYVVGEFFAVLIGAPGFGRLVVSLSILLGGLLGGFGGVVGRTSLELVEELRLTKTSHQDD